MQKKSAFLIVAVALACSFASFAQKPEADPVKKLGAFLGKWQTEGIFGNGTKAKSELVCRWSPQNRYLVCEQDVTLSSGHSHQLTVYGYNEKTGKYSFLTLQDNAGKPASGDVEIKDNVWAYDLAVDDKTQVRTLNEFTTPKTEVFKVFVSDDHGANWRLTLQGTAHKIAE